MVLAFTVDCISITTVKHQDVKYKAYFPIARQTQESGHQLCWQSWMRTQFMKLTCLSQNKPKKVADTLVGNLGAMPNNLYFQSY